MHLSFLTPLNVSLFTLFILKRSSRDKVPGMTPLRHFKHSSQPFCLWPFWGGTRQVLSLCVCPVHSIVLNNCVLNVTFVLNNCVSNVTFVLNNCVLNVTFVLNNCVLNVTFVLNNCVLNVTFVLYTCVLNVTFVLNSMFGRWYMSSAFMINFLVLLWMQHILSFYSVTCTNIDRITRYPMTIFIYITWSCDFFFGLQHFCGIRSKMLNREWITGYCSYRCINTLGCSEGPALVCFKWNKEEMYRIYSWYTTYI